MTVFSLTPNSTRSPLILPLGDGFPYRLNTSHNGYLHDLTCLTIRLLTSWYLIGFAQNMHFTPELARQPGDVRGSAVTPSVGSRVAATAALDRSGFGVNHAARVEMKPLPNHNRKSGLR